MPEAKEIADQLRLDYKTTFESESGRRVLDDLKNTCFYNNSTINESSNVMAWAEGQRNVVLHIHTKLNLTHEKLKELENERG